MSHPILSYDFTLSADKNKKSLILTVLKELAKDWAFQLEKSPETGYLHFQGRMKLKVKTQKSTLVKKLSSRGIVIHDNAITPTSTCNVKNDFYVTKSDTRVEGPWRSTDEELAIPVDVANIEQLLPWQDELKIDLQRFDGRIVDVICDTIGGKGKSTFIRYMRSHGLARILPAINSVKDLMQAVICQPDSKVYLIDLPRSFPKSHLFEFWAAIEMIKTGYAFDSRYHFKEKLFNPPRVVVFTNILPDEGHLSRDRWRFWNICDNKLVPYNRPETQIDEKINVSAETAVLLPVLPSQTTCSILTQEA